MGRARVQKLARRVAIHMTIVWAGPHATWYSNKTRLRQHTWVGAEQSHGPMSKTQMQKRRKRSWTSERVGSVAGERDLDGGRSRGYGVHPRRRGRSRAGIGWRQAERETTGSESDLPTRSTSSAILGNVALLGCSPQSHALQGPLQSCSSQGSVRRMVPRLASGRWEGRGGGRRRGEASEARGGGTSRRLSGARAGVVEQ